MQQIVCIGECMIELARRNNDRFELKVGGDTFNTAIYLARLGAPVAYMTAVGDDPYSAMILDTAHQEGVDCNTIQVVAGRMPGLYLIETQAGERSFWYWRDTSPARELFELQGTAERLKRVANASTIYLSGITLSLYSPDGLDRLEEALVQARQSGGRVVIDSNYRPAGWQRDLERARRVYGRFWAHADIALPSFDDERALWGDKEPSDTLNRLGSFGVGEICLKMADEGAIVQTDGSAERVPPIAAIEPVDTTAAGDSFSAAYLWARLNGQPPAQAAANGHRLAGIVIQHHGAIAPKKATASFKI